MADIKEPMANVGGKVSASMKRRLRAWRQSRAYPISESEALRQALKLLLEGIPDPLGEQETD